LRIVAELDEGVLVNNARDPLATPNMGCDHEAAKLVEGGCDLYDFALQDIKAGDELLFRYSDFSTKHAWGSFGF
jgi:hypothetical protein